MYKYNRIYIELVKARVDVGIDTVKLHNACSMHGYKYELGKGHKSSYGEET